MQEVGCCLSLNEELGRQRGGEGKVECSLYPAYNSSRLIFLGKPKAILGERYQFAY